MSIVPLLAGGTQGSWWTPPAASSFASDVDFVFEVIFWICLAFFILIVAATMYFAWKYRARPGHQEQVTITHHAKLEMVWTIFPSILLVGIFVVGTVVYIEMIEPPPAMFDQIDANSDNTLSREEFRKGWKRLGDPDAEFDRLDVNKDGVVAADEAPELFPLQINVLAEKWSWKFDHPMSDGSRKENVMELHVVLNRPVQLSMSSVDVIHSLYVPAFRQKQDVVPGRVTRMWFMPTQVGKFPLVCTEYCGDNHSAMLTTCIVHATHESYQEALSKAKRTPEILYEKVCKSCHSIDGAGGTGPTFKGLMAKGESEMTDGSRVKIDRAYIAESLANPGAKIVKGFTNQMTPQKVTDEELDDLIEWLKTIK